METVAPTVLELAPFSNVLAEHNLALTRDSATTLQVNVGKLCNLECQHCHVEAGPDRQEVMEKNTIDNIVSFASRCDFEVVDITGGAPELNPNLAYLVSSIYNHVPKLMLRTNLTSLPDKKYDQLINTLSKYKVVIVASLPSVSQLQTDAQRGNGIFEKSLTILKKLNEAGYGCKNSGLELDIVSNPTGAFFPPSQSAAEKRFKSYLDRRWGIEFNNLYVVTNVPLGRFQKWLVKSSNYENYMHKLADSFNPGSIGGVMCRSYVSVSWNGFLYDCDFNQATNLPLGGSKTHVTDLDGPPMLGDPIAVSDHCYSCTAGAGFNCGGSID